MSEARIFLAIALPDSLRTVITNRFVGLKAVVGANVRWVAPENLHLTLRFLGATDAARLPVLEKAVRQVCARQVAFDFAVGGFGAFPSLHRPRVLWVGVHAPPELAKLQSELEQAVVGLGFPAEKQAFSPHLTLGRVREPIGTISLATLRTGLAAIHIGNLETVRVDFIHLYRSDLQPDQPRYSLLFKAPLGA